jgi:hypothetical protein
VPNSYWLALALRSKNVQGFATLFLFVQSPTGVPSTSNPGDMKSEKLYFASGTANDPEVCLLSAQLRAYCTLRLSSEFVLVAEANVIFFSMALNGVPSETSRLHAYNEVWKTTIKRARTKLSSIGHSRPFWCM